MDRKKLMNRSEKMNHRKNPLTEYGIAIKEELLKRGKTQNWLIAEVKKMHPTKHLDVSHLNKIMTGQIKRSEIMNAIDRILGTTH
jgi:uncharacterized membrane protein YcaP (DUF421 family)